MMKELRIALIGFFLLICGAQPALADQITCLPLGKSKAELMQLRSDNFVGLEDKFDAFAVALLPCLSSPDPELRDKIAYEAYTWMLRERKLQKETVHELNTSLMAALKGTDAEGFQAPFAALVLSEVARADRIENIFSDGERQKLVEAGTHYLVHLKDYRGFDPKEGWRHGVAHTADLLMQLALNDQLTKEQLLQMRDAIGAQLMPKEHFYIYGEPERLARPLLYIARRGLITQEEWDGWFAKVGTSAPFESWGDVYFSQEGLSRRHNLRNFLLSIYTNATASEAEEYKVLIPGTLQLLRATS